MGRWRRSRRRGLAVQPLSALHAKAVPSEIVMTTGRTDQAPGWIRLQPALALAAVPDPVLGTQHPPPALVVEHGEIAHSDPERARLEIAGAPRFDPAPVSDRPFA